MSHPVILFLPHGGGPLPLLDDPAHAELTAFLRDWPQTQAVPEQIVLISAHWETPVPSVTAGTQPSLIYDYGGFPPEAYEVQYPAPGSPTLASSLADALQSARFSVLRETERGYDHGMFVPLKLMYPQANIPCVQLSLLDSLDPAEHWAIGEALSQTFDERTLVIGSGLSFHNLSVFRSSEPAVVEHARQFDDWLVNTCTSRTIDAATRRQMLINWAQAPSARFCHPREEHLLPCHVCSGLASGRPATAVYRQPLRGKPVCALQW